MANDILEELKQKLGKDNFAGCAVKGNYATRFKEIAEITGVSINTALGRMRYALLNLRRMASKKELHLAIS